MAEKRKRLRVKIGWLDGKSVPLQALSPMSEQAWAESAEASCKQVKEQRRIKTEYENGVFAKRFGWEAKDET